MGWDHPAVVADMDRAAKYLVDRLTGANVLDSQQDPKEDPPQRPFDLASVTAAMLGRGMTVSKASSGPSTLTYLYNGDDKTYLLAPSIASVATGDSKMVLTGIFGPSDPTNAKITVGGADCAINADRWTRTTAECKVDDTAMGEVVVTVSDHESNHVKLTSWRGNLTYTFLSSPPGLSLVWTLAMHLRGDIHDYREKPGQAPVQHATILELVADSKGTVAVDGIATDPSGNTADWGKVTKNLGVGGGVGPNYYNGWAKVDKGDPTHLWFELRGETQTDLCHEVVKNSKGTTISDTKKGFTMPWFEVSDTNQGVLYARLKNPANLSDTGTIAAGGVGPVASQSAAAVAALNWTQQVDWTQITPEAATAPDPKQDQH